ncbi:hypothetical protein [Chengkuizengella axinellae]|uniref:DUF3221 domain-containing protein n=1 Tax=Chengkuizengella axinellae TaxID=3064388 RepID=A0ABT9J3C0_9BACL|nr:hypothetical protein [Chengkuizengella sp. 2205SS18-9]MDP5276121.1 hypothetical protein [Chengkuizengella sp. 2205SS18-9]
MKKYILIFLCILITIGGLFLITIYNKDEQIKEINVEQIIGKTSSPEEMIEHTYSGNIVEINDKKIVITNGEEEESYRITDNTKVQNGVSYASLDLIKPGLKANILSYNGVAKIIHVKVN